MNTDQKDLPLPDPDLEKPNPDLPAGRQDLPLPEKEIPAKNTDGKRNRFPILKAFVIGFIMAATIAAFSLIAYLFMGNQDESQLVNDNSSMVNETPTPTPDPTADWKTYISANGTYQMKYPSNYNQFSAQAYAGGYEEINLAYSPDNKINKNNQNPSQNEILILPRQYVVPFDISGHTNDEIIQKLANREGTSKYVSGDTVVPWINENGETYNGERVYVSADFEQTTINGYEAAKLYKSNDSLCYLILKNKKSNVEICALPADSDYISEFEQIISTFKFTDTESTLDTSGWKTYAHPQLNYKIKYPPDWVLSKQAIPTQLNAPYKYDLIDIKTADYDADYILNSGAELSVSAEDTDEDNIEKIFNSSLGAEIAQNKKVVSLNGIEAIQFSFSYEGTMATITEFIKDGVHYTLRYRYVNGEEKSKNWDNYQEFMNSLKFAE